MFDEIDRTILGILQRNARTSNSEIARQLNMAPSAILERIRKLEARGVIQGYEARLDPKSTGHELVAFVFIRTDDRWDNLETAGKLHKIPEVLEIHALSGEDCYLVKLRVADMDALRRVLRDKISAIKSVVHTRTTIVLGTMKETTRLPLDGLAASKARSVRARVPEPPPVSL